MTTEQQFDSQDASVVVGPGQLLRSAREAMGWTREQVASRLHLRLTLIAAIETDTYDKHTSPTFIRGYLRTYAKLVGVEESTILAAYATLGLEPQQSIKMQSFSKRTRLEANNSRLKFVSWLVILVLAGLLFAWWWQNSNRRAAGQEELAASEISKPAAVEAAAGSNNTDADTSGDIISPIPEVEGSASDAEPAMTTPVATDATSASVASQPAAPSTSAADATAVAATAVQPAGQETAAQHGTSDAASAPQLKLGFTADCWFEVRDASGKVLFSGLKKANDEMTFEGKEPFRLLIGAPMAARIQFKGQDIDMSRYNNGRTARITLPQQE